MNMYLPSSSARFEQCNGIDASERVLMSVDRFGLPA